MIHSHILFCLNRFMVTSVDELKLGAQKPPMPYSDTRLLNVLSHTLWFLPNVASCYAMANLLAQKQNVGNQIGAKTLDLNVDFKVIAAQLDKIAEEFFQVKAA